MNADYFNTRIKDIKEKLNSLNDNEINDGVLLANIDIIRNQLFDILDHTINHFPGYGGNSDKIYFPILNIGDDVTNLQNNKHFMFIKKHVGQKAEKFILDSYNIIFNLKYDNCLILLNSASKHRNLDKIGKEKNDIEGEWYTSGSEQIEKNIYGNLNIPGFCPHGTGNNVHMSNVLSVGQNGVTFIKELNTKRVPGNSLIINKNGMDIEVHTKLFLDKCIQCTEEIVNLWNNTK